MQSVFVLSHYHNLSQYHIKHIAIAVVVSEAKFVYVSLQILYRYMMIYAIDTALEYRPKALYVVCMRSIIITKGFCMVNSQVDEFMLAQSVIASKFIRHNYVVVFLLRYLIQGPLTVLQLISFLLHSALLL